MVTDKGTIHAEHVVNCAGLWAREIGRMVGLELPVLAMEHHYIVTEAIPELAGLDREIVNTTDYSGEIYMRQEGKGALLGTYEQQLRRLGAGADAGRFRHAAAAGRFRADRALARGRLRAFSGRRPRRHQEGHQRAVHLRAGRQSAGRAGPRPARISGSPAPSWRASARAAASASCCRAGWRKAIPAPTSWPWTSSRFGAFATPKYTSLKVHENYRRRFRLAFPNEELPGGAAVPPHRRSTTG